MSHDESEHTYFAWLLSEGSGYQHTPITHGPLQFILLAFTYIFFGVTDATSRFPVAISGVLAVAMLFAYKRWLGRAGAIIAMALMVVSPYMLFYTRYVRNEALLLPVTLLMFYGLFRYFETKRNLWFYIFTAGLTLHYLIKETAFMYTVELIVFMAALLIWELLKRPWKDRTYLIAFLAGLVASIAGVLILFSRIESIGVVEGESEFTLSALVVIGFFLTALGLITLAVSMVMNFGIQLRTDFPALDILIVCITLTVPQLAAFPANALGWDPLNYQNVETMVRTFIVVVTLIFITAAIGIAWDWRRWFTIAAIFFIPYFISYTTFFTNIAGIATGMVGSFGYWLAQQEVERGGQPWYYYFAVQIPIYEYILVVGTAVAAAIGLIGLFKKRNGEDKREEETPSVEGGGPFPVLGFLGYWVMVSLILFTYAGEKMPWLTVHIALPMLLLSGWAYGRLIDGLKILPMRPLRASAIILLLIIGLYAFARAIFELIIGTPVPADEAAAGLINQPLFISVVVAAFAAAGVWILSSQEKEFPVGKWIAALAIAALFLLTARTAFMASFKNFDFGTEFLVYAHSERGVKDMMSDLEELSIAVTGGNDIDVAFDVADGTGDPGVSWPVNWYMRFFPNSRSYGPEITRDLRAYPVVIASDNNWSRLEPLISDHFQQFEHIRMVWPMQDYWNLTWEKIREALVSAEFRRALWDIWLDRDYTAYGEVVGKDYSRMSWQPSDRMKMYVRNDIASTFLGIGDDTYNDEVLTGDPYKEGHLDLFADPIIGTSGSEPGQFEAPLSIAFASDGSMYVADSRNHRIQLLSPEGDVLNTWGSFANILEESAPSGTFNEPWGIAVGPDGSVYVADTWNHRIQKFTSDGTFITMWGTFGAGATPQELWGPRDVAVDTEGRVFVADTGNKRILLFNEDGSFLSQISSGGFGPGELDEPVGIAIGTDSTLYVADTWNQRVQVFKEFETNAFAFEREWPVDGWFGMSLENKPYLDLGPQEEVCVTEPEGYRVLCFDNWGVFIFGWGSYGTGSGQFDLPTGITIDDEGYAWISDSRNNRIMRFEVPWESAGVSQ